VTNTLTVTREQVVAARALIELRGGEANVDPVIARIAHAEPRNPAKPAGKSSPPAPSSSYAAGRRTSTP